MSYMIISREDYEEMLKLVAPHDIAVRHFIACSEPVIPTIEASSSQASSEEDSKEDYPLPEHHALRIEELVQECDPSLPPAPPVLSRQVGLYISPKESCDEEC